MLARSHACVSRAARLLRCSVPSATLACKDALSSSQALRASRHCALTWAARASASCGVCTAFKTKVVIGLYSASGQVVRLHAPLFRGSSLCTLTSWVTNNVPQLGALGCPSCEKHGFQKIWCRYMYCCARLNVRPMAFDHRLATTAGIRRYIRSWLLRCAYTPQVSCKFDKADHRTAGAATVSPLH